MTADRLPLGLRRGPEGPVELAWARAVDAATALGELSDVHAAAVELGRSLARGVDDADDARSARARADCSKELRQVLTALGLDRASRGELTGKAPGGDPFDELTRAMSAATGDQAAP